MATAATPNADPTIDKPPRSRRWIPLSLRMFAVMIVLLCLGSVFLVWLPFQREQEVVHKIEGLGGSVGAPWIAPDWFLQFVGVDRMRAFKVLTRVKVVSLGHMEITNAGLADLSKLKRLEVLILNHTHVSDGGLVHLSGLTNLNELYLNDTDVSDAGLVHLKGLPSLFFLALVNTKVTETGIEDLQAAMPKCESVYR